MVDLFCRNPQTDGVVRLLVGSIGSSILVTVPLWTVSSHSIYTYEALSSLHIHPKQNFINIYQEYSPDSQ